MSKIHYIFLLLVGLVICSPAAFAQDALVSPVYGWHAYTSHNSVIEISTLGDSAYVITGGGLIVHNLINEENSLFSTPEGLSSVDPSAVLADPASRKVFVGYKNGAINYFDPDGKIHVISDISRNEQFPSKHINHFVIVDGLLYIATDFGVVVYDISLRETRYSVTKVSSNPTGSLVSSVAVAQGRLWISMEQLGVWSAELASGNPTIPALWRKESGISGLPLGSSTYICASNDILYAQVQDTVFIKSPALDWTVSVFPIEDWNYLNTAEGNVFGTFRRSGLMLQYADGNLLVEDNFGKIMCLAVSKYGDAIIGDSLGGLQRIWFGEGFSENGLKGPKNNNVADMAAYNGELYVAPKGRQGSSARSYDKSGIPFFDLNAGGWSVTDHRDGTLTDVYQDFYRIAIDSTTGRCFVGSWGEGIVEMLNGEFVRDYNSSNSGLAMGIAGHMVSGLAFDEVGNLWISLALNEVSLQCLTPDGQWFSFEAPFSLDAFGLTLDALGNKWILNSGEGAVVFNDNFTPGDISDDQWRTITSDRGNGGLTNNSVNCMAEDHDLQIWIGTSEGVTIMYDPTLLFTTDFQDVACPIIEGYCLFRDQQVNDIVVDGYNRKWIATENGAFLVNLDGTELLEHFTEADSPLLSDDVRSIAIDPRTGEVFFGTAKGIISYMGDAIDGRADATELYAYPNPAFEDQETPVIIKGMRKFSKVKIATVSGRLVRELDAQGGEVPWDLHDSYGNAITPGIYLIMVSDPDGKGAGVSKIAILEKQN